MAELKKDKMSCYIFYYTSPKGDHIVVGEVHGISEGVASIMKMEMTKSMGIPINYREIEHHE